MRQGLGLTVGKELFVCTFLTRKKVPKNAPLGRPLLFSRHLAWTDFARFSTLLGRQALACPFCSSAIVVGSSTSCPERRLSRDALSFAWPIEWGQNPPLNRAKGNRIKDSPAARNAYTTR